MAANLRPSTPKARALLRKLQALAERGIDGERLSAQNKIARLKARYDFGLNDRADPAETPNLFSGAFQRARKARTIYSFEPAEFDVANSVKWAIESATKIPCHFRDGELLTEATATTARRLKEIADHIACSFRALLVKFRALEGLSVSDRAAFVMGLYDGMMNEARAAGQRLPSRPLATKRKQKKREVAGSRGLHVHPYTLAVNLGKQIRFSAPVEQITAELDAVIQKHLSDGQQPA
jgi:hypothetical protein